MTGPAFTGPEPGVQVEEHFAIPIYTARQLAALELPAPADPIVGPYVRRGMATLIGGVTGHGKTTLIGQAVAAAVNGGEFLGEQCAGGERVLILDLEQHLESIQRGIREAGLDSSDAVDYATIREGLALDRRGDQLAAVEGLLAAKEYGLLVVDPFYKLHEADSSDEQQARLLVALLRRWIADYGFAELMATHCRKRTDGGAITLDDLFGSSLFTRDPEIVLGVQRYSGITKLRVFKSREPGIDQGQVLDLLFERGRGYWLKPEKDPEKEAARREEICAAIAAYIEAHPGASQRAIREALPYAKTAVETELRAGFTAEHPQGRSDRPWGRVRAGGGAWAYYLADHAVLSGPETLLGPPGAAGASRPEAPETSERPRRPPPSKRGARDGGRSAGALPAAAEEEEIERLAAVAREAQQPLPAEEEPGPA